MTHRGGLGARQIPELLVTDTAWGHDSHTLDTAHQGVANTAHTDMTHCLQLAIAYKATRAKH